MMTPEQEIIYLKNMVKTYKFDHLTGLKMRYDFEMETAHKMKNEQFYLYIVDAIGLHALNRKKGSDAGDALLKQIAYDLQQKDCWEVYRYGGDEFMALFFEEPTGVEIENATCAYVNSEDFDYFTDMVKEVDRLVTEKKITLNRRRED